MTEEDIEVLDRRLTREHESSGGSEWETVDVLMMGRCPKTKAYGEYWRWRRQGYGLDAATMRNLRIEDLAEMARVEKCSPTPNRQR